MGVGEDLASQFILQTPAVMYLEFPVGKKYHIKDDL